MSRILCGLMVVAFAVGCGKEQPATDAGAPTAHNHPAGGAPSSAPATGANHPPVKFEIGGAKIGDAASLAARKDLGAVGNGSHYEKLDIVPGGGCNLILHYRGFKLMYVNLHFDRASFPEVLKALTAQFGCPPHSVSHSVVKAKDGGEQQSEVAVWETDSGPFTIYSYLPTAGNGWGVLETPEFAAELRREAEARKAKMKGKA